MKNFLYKAFNAYKFGGIRYMWVIFEDLVFHTNKKRKFIADIIATCEFNHLQKKAEAYFSMKTGQEIDFNNPKRFNEKIQWFMLYNNTQIKADLTDKYRVRKYVEDKIGANKLIPLLGKWNNYDDIDFNILPERFILKCTHGSGMNVIIRDKNAINHDVMRRQFSAWLHTNFAYNNFELHYKYIIPQIIAEEYIEEIDGNLFDYKVHCFNGEPRYIQLIGNRDIIKHTAYQLIYNFNWEQQNWSFGDYPRYNYEISCPKNLAELYKCSKKLCEGFDYVRTDFYIIDETVLFGEMTFTPNAGLYVYNNDFNEDIDRMLGDMIKISE